MRFRNQRRMHRKKPDTDGVICYLENLLIAYRSEQNLYLALESVMESMDDSSGLYEAVSTASERLFCGSDIDMENPYESALLLIESYIGLCIKDDSILQLVTRAHDLVVRMESVGTTDDDAIDKILQELRDSSRECGRGRRGYRIKGGIMMTTAAVCVVAVVVQGMIYMDKLKEQRLRSSLSQAMSDCVSEVFVDEDRFSEKDKNHNTLLAVFLQSMLKKVDDDVDLTVKVCNEDASERALEVEAIGEYKSPLNIKHKVSVRRRIAF